MHLSQAQQSALTTLEESEGDTSKVSISYAIADRSRCKVNEEIATQLQKKRTWVPPKFASIHFNSNCMIKQRKLTTEERLVAVGDNKNNNSWCSGQEQTNNLAK